MRVCCEVKGGKAKNDRGAVLSSMLIAKVSLNTCCCIVRCCRSSWWRYIPEEHVAFGGVGWLSAGHAPLAVRGIPERGEMSLKLKTLLEDD